MGKVQITVRFITINNESKNNFYRKTFHFNKPPYSLTGIVIVTSVPLWNSLDILILPLNDGFKRLFCDMARPRPVPPVSRERALSTR